MGLKKAFDTKNLSNKSKAILNTSKNSYLNLGINGEQLDEVKVRYNKTPGESLIQGPRNTYIKQGYDRPGERNSGRGGETGAGSISIVAGPMSARPLSSEISPQREKQKLFYADPNLYRDAAMIYIEQKTDADVNFNLTSGKGGSSTARSAIVAKADVIRIIGREGIKLISRVDDQNSLGGGVRSVPRIELIAGNRDSGMQPSTKASANNKSIEKIYKRLDELNSTLDFFMTSQFEFNQQVMSHQHPDSFSQLVGLLGAFNPLAINAGQTLPSFSLMAAGMKCSAQEMISKQDNVMNKLKSTITQVNSTEIFGTNQAGSKSIFSN